MMFFFFFCPNSRLRIWSRETGSAVPSRVSPLILHTQAGSGAYSREYSHLPRRRPHIYRQPPSGQSRVYRVTQFRADGIHCRESSGTAPIVLKVARVTGAALSGITTDQFICSSHFPNPPLLLAPVCLHNGHGMCDPESIGGVPVGDFTSAFGRYIRGRFEGSIGSVRA